MTRADGRAFDQLRPVELTKDYIKFAEGSVLIRCGDTVVLCNASVEEKTPPHVLKLSGRSAEIQRLIGRSLRSAVDREALGERTITVDCDVLQGDGGTRTASVTGGFVALALACRKLLAEGKVMRDPIIHQVAAVSAGIIDEVPVLDLPYSEDSRAQVDLNCVMNEKGELIELQGTGEGRSFTLSEQQELVRLCAKGIRELMEKQREILQR